MRSFSRGNVPLFAVVAVLSALCLVVEPCEAWMVTPSTTATRVPINNRQQQQQAYQFRHIMMNNQRSHPHRQPTSMTTTSGRSPSSSSTTKLAMSFNLPPGRNNNELSSVLSSVVGFGLFAAFVFSPLGGFLFSILNGFLALSILLPFGAAAAFSVWQYFNTVSGPCPNCGAPVRVFKRQGGDVIGNYNDNNFMAGSPTICYSCGTVVQTLDNETIVNVSGRNTLNDLEQEAGFSSLFDSFFGGTGQQQSYYSDRQQRQQPTRRTTTVTKTTTRRRSRGGNEIIDVEVTREDD